MILDLKEISADWKNYSLNLTDKELLRLLDTKLVCNLDICCNLSLKKDTTEKISLEANLTGNCVRNCDLCLKDINKKINYKFKLDIVPFNKDKAEINLVKQISLEEADTDFYHSQKIDLIKYIEDYLLIELLEYFKCQDDCKGSYSA